MALLKVIQIGNMMRTRLVLFVIFFMMFADNVEGRIVPKANWNVIPLPQEVRLCNAEPFVLSPSTTIYVGKLGGKDLRRCGRFLSNYIKEMTGIAVGTTRKRQDNQITLAIDSSIEQQEGYQIHAQSHRVELLGKNPGAIFHAVQTFRKALPISENSKTILLPAVDIVDYPNYAYRGFLLDVGRHFFSIDCLKRMIDELSLHNINYFHLHLTEDQGWRLAIKGYPHLISVGSHRVGSLLSDNTVDTVTVSGFYTQKQVRDLVAYAAARFITIIPEIDMPGHMSAALAAYPQFGCTGGPYKVQNRWGVFPDVLCAGNGKAVKFAQDVIRQVIELFPSPYIHLGGDECPKTRWKHCPKCQAKISELNFKDVAGHSKEDQLQNWFMEQAGRLVRQNGRKVMGWNEILNGNPAKDVVVLAWTGPGSVIDAARRGYHTIVCPISNFYLSDPNNLRRKGRDSFSSIYDYPVEPTALNQEDKKNIVGVQGCIWTEWVPTEKELQRELLPRLTALAEVQWTKPERRNVDSLLQRLPQILSVYKLNGYYYRTDLLDSGGVSK